MTLHRFHATAAALALLALATPKSASANPSKTSIEQGFDLGQLQGPRSLAMGNALSALGSSTTALDLNPAAMSLARVYHLEAMASYGPEAVRQSYGASIVDSVLNTQHIAGGLTANWSLMDPDGINRSWTDVRAALAYPFGDRLAVGVTGRYLRVEQSTTGGPLGASLASGGTAGSAIVDTVTFDAGATLMIIDALRVGIVGKNLTNPGTGLAPTTIQAGLGLSLPSFVLEADGLVDFTTYTSAKLRAMAGAELFLGDRIALRAGYRYDEGTQTHALGGGLGYVDKSFSIEFGIRHDVAGEHPSTLMTLSFRYFHNPLSSSDAPAPDGF